MKRKRKSRFLIYAVLLAGLAVGGKETSTELSTEPIIEQEEIVNVQIEETVEETVEDTVESSYMEVHYIDVGQADATLIMCDDQSMLIDGGNAEDSSLIYAYLEDQEVEYLDYIICTHAHEDHVGGLAGALNYATVGTAYSPVTTFDTRAFNSFLKYLKNQDVELTIPSKGTTFSLGGAECEILWLDSETEEVNNTSIVLKVQHKKNSFLFSGDAEYNVEADIIEAGTDISCTVLKVPHHGSDTSSSYRWIRESNPSYAVISVGEDNSYGHPTEDTLSKYRDADVEVFRTDLQGDIICKSDGETVSFYTERNQNIDTLGYGIEEENTEEQAEEYSYILNTNTKKFHYPTCSSVKQMKDKNKQAVESTRDEIVGQGYSPCGNCHP